MKIAIKLIRGLSCNITTKSLLLLIALVIAIIIDSVD